MPRSTKPWWGARALYELQIDSTSPFPTEIELGINRVVADLGIPKPLDYADVCHDAAIIGAWSQQPIPERRRIRQALREAAYQLGELEGALDHLSPVSRSKLGIIEQSGQFDSETGAEATLLLEFPRQLLLLSRRIGHTEANDLEVLRTHVDACVDLLTRLDDFSQSHLLDGLWEQREVSKSVGPETFDATQWLLIATKLLRAAADQETIRLGRKGRDEHPWLHWAVSMLAERFETLTNKKLTYFVNRDDIPVPSEGGKFIIGVIRASGARLAKGEKTILNAIRGHVHAEHIRSGTERTE